MLPIHIGLLAVLGRGCPLLRARRRHQPVQDLLGRGAADRVGRPGRAGRGGRLGVPALARIGLRGRLRRGRRFGHGARRLRAVHRRGQPGVALRAQRDRRPGVAALRVNIIESKELSPGGLTPRDSFIPQAPRGTPPALPPQSGMWKPINSSLDRSSAEWTGRRAMAPSALA